MGIAVMIAGESGSGKSASMRTLDPDKVGIINVAGKPLPFRGTKFRTVNTHSYTKIADVLKTCKADTIVIDDSQYLMAFENFAKVNEAGYGKFTLMAQHFEQLLEAVMNLPPQKIVYFMHHPETDSNTGRQKVKTLGKMLDSQLTVQGMFAIVLWCYTDGKRHWFSTQSDGTNTAKSPMEMFPAEIDNDLALVDKTIREYYGI